MSDNSAGVSFCGLLAILFIGLKLGGVLQWSWVWVLAPLWIPWVAWMVILVLLLMVAGIMGFAKEFLK